VIDDLGMLLVSADARLTLLVLFVAVVVVSVFVAGPASDPCFFCGLLVLLSVYFFRLCCGEGEGRVALVFYFLVRRIFRSRM